MSMPTTIPTTRKSVTVLSWDDFESLITNCEVPLTDADVINGLWGRAQEGQEFDLSTDESKLINRLQNVA